METDRESVPTDGRKRVFGSGAVAGKYTGKGKHPLTIVSCVETRGRIQFGSIIESALIFSNVFLDDL